MYSTVSNRIIENWLEQLSNNGAVDQSLIELIRELAQENSLNSTERLKEAIISLEESDEDKNQNIDS